MDPSSNSTGRGVALHATPLRIPPRSDGAAAPLRLVDLPPAEPYRPAAPLPATAPVEETAAGVHRIMNSHMADLLRSSTIERGHDPRDFALFAYGGAAASHAIGYAGTPTDCWRCHESAAPLSVPAHQSSYFQECDTCHRTYSWTAISPRAP